MTAFKDWNEAHFNGYRAREVADFIWTEAETKASAKAGAANSSGNCNAEEQKPDTETWPRFSRFSGFSMGAAENLECEEQALEPLPLVRRLPAADPFPVDALGPTMAKASRAFQAKTQAPMAIAANAVLAVACLATQAHADVQLPTGEVKPLSLYLLTKARSGERKTSTDGHALAPVKSHESDLRLEHERALARHENEKAAWEAERKIIVSSKKMDLNTRTNALDKLGPEPKPPLSPIIICHEPTFEGLTKLLASGQPSIGIFASEGGLFIGGHGFSEEAKLRTAAGLSLLWDDGHLNRVRATDGATALAGRRVALHLQVQPDVAARLFSDPVLEDQGLLSRICVVAPDSNQSGSPGLRSSEFGKEACTHPFRVGDATRLGP